MLGSFRSIVPRGSSLIGCTSRISYIPEARQGSGLLRYDGRHELRIRYSRRPSPRRRGLIIIKLASGRAGEESALGSPEIECRRAPLRIALSGESPAHLADAGVDRQAVSERLVELLGEAAGCLVHDLR